MEGLRGPSLISVGMILLVTPTIITVTLAPDAGAASEVKTPPGRSAVRLACRPDQRSPFGLSLAH